MFSSLVQPLLGGVNDRAVSALQPLVAKINRLEDDTRKCSDAALRKRTAEFRKRIEAGESLDSILPEAFATVREAAWRSIGQRHFDVQLMGGIVLHQGKITEMKTGEGKTLVATLAVYLNALAGKGVHVVTVNDYLAERDSQWMGQIYKFLGLEVGCIKSGLGDAERRAAYQADVTYATNNEIGFDYLRDNMKFQLADMVQRPPNFAIIDEVDSILIDEARTPLVISGVAEDSSALYIAVNKIIPRLTEADFERDEKQRTITLTDQGIEHVEQLLATAGLLKAGSLYEVENVRLLHHVNMGLRAHYLFRRDSHYMVRSGKLVIIDEFTGRAMEGRRFGEGLHQALEAKEGVKIQAENQTLASITYQNLFRLYPKLAGMTGTALTEAGEFSEIYSLEVVAIPTNMPVARNDHEDEVYRSAEERDEAIIKQIDECRGRGQPVLVGTVSIEKSEKLSKILTKKKIPHQVLNAKFHEAEAKIIAEAGVPGSVTIATNMAGRGTDIQLGGNLEARLAKINVDSDSDADVDVVKKTAIEKEVADAKQKALTAGGLYVIGTERHESRRIDNQLRGRSGRQGDAGDSKFFISLQDDLMRIFGSDRIDATLVRLGLEEGEAISHPWISKAIEKAQSKVEARNFEIRKQLLRYDDVMNDQRKVIFQQRREIMDADEVAETIADMRASMIEEIATAAIFDDAQPDDWDGEALRAGAARLLGLAVPAEEWLGEQGMDRQTLVGRLTELANAKQTAKEAEVGADLMRQAEKSFLLQILDQHWKDHLLALDQMRQSVALRAYAQRDPLNEYKREAFLLFDQMLDGMRETVTAAVSSLEFRPAAERGKPLPQGAQAGMLPGGVAGAGKQNWGKTPRNARCPCGSGKKYKHCHGKIAV